MGAAGKRGTDGGERRCVATRASLPVDRLLRFAVAPDGALTPDIRAKLPGRGVWTALSRAAVDEAVRQKAFARSLKTPVRVGEGLADRIDALLAADALQALSIANKAGLVVTGFGKVEALIGSGQARALVEAADGQPDGRRKLFQALLRRHGERATEVVIVDCFASSDLTLALGRDLVIHAALKTGAAAEGFLRRWRRLVLFRTSPLPSAETDSPSPTISRAGPILE